MTMNKSSSSTLLSFSEYQKNNLNIHAKVFKQKFDQNLLNCYVFHAYILSHRIILTCNLYVKR